PRVPRRPAVAGGRGIEDRRLDAGVLETRTELIARSIVSARVEVTRTARLAVAPCLHIPEESLSEPDHGRPRGAGRSQIVVQRLRCGCRDGAKGCAPGSTCRSPYGASLKRWTIPSGLGLHRRAECEPEHDHRDPHKVGSPPHTASCRVCKWIPKGRL